MNRNWSNREVAAIVADYFDMLSKELRHIPYNKTEHRKRLGQQLNGRSDGSIEFKHQNISAILIQFGRPYISGYLPRSNYQKSLESAVLDYLELNDRLEKEFDLFTEANDPVDRTIDFNAWTEPVPQWMHVNEPKIEYNTRKLSKINYIEKEQANRSLGENGEKLVLEYERWRLIHSDKEALADKVEWIAKDQGDGAGFDILSKNIDGSDRYIEVKTTKLGKYTPIFLTKNELYFSREKESDFYLYRVFEFTKSAKLFFANGALDNICNLEPTNYMGRFK